MPVFFFCLICAAGEHPCRIQPAMCGRIIFHHWHFSSWSSVTSCLPVFSKRDKAAADVWVWFCDVAERCFLWFYILRDPVFETFHQRRPKPFTDMAWLWNKEIHHFNAETMFSTTCHFQLPWRWRRCCRAWWTTTWWTANELVHQTITGPFPVKSCMLENVNWRSCNNRWFISLSINSWQAVRLQN